MRANSVLLLIVTMAASVLAPRPTFAIVLSSDLLENLAHPGETTYSLNLDGVAHRPKLAQLSHELFVGEVFLHYLDSGMDTDREWVGEDQFPKPWPIRSRPDALICNQDGEYIRAVEYGGAYSVQRLSTLHNALKSISMPYEVW